MTEDALPETIRVHVTANDLVDYPQQTLGLLHAMEQNSNIPLKDKQGNYTIAIPLADADKKSLQLMEEALTSSAPKQTWDHDLENKKGARGIYYLGGVAAPALGLTFLPLISITHTIVQNHEKDSWEKVPGVKPSKAFEIGGEIACGVGLLMVVGSFYFGYKCFKKARAMSQNIRDMLVGNTETKADTLDYIQKRQAELTPS